MPAVFIVIGLAGMLLANVFYEKVDSEIKILNVLNAYNQFTFIFFSFIYILVFAQDYKKGINVFMEQIGFSEREVLCSKGVWLYLISLLSTNITLIILFFYLGNNDISYLCTMLFSLDLNLIFIILFSMFLAVLVKNNMIATLICFAMFIVFNTANLLCFGIFNQADPNSISYNAIYQAIGEKVTQDTLNSLPFRLADYTLPLIILPNIVWIILLALTILFLTRKGRKTNGL
jgi:ABC-type transport system involved in multi-copper enzyme maturation permease subunit